MESFYSAFDITICDYKWKKAGIKLQKREKKPASYSSNKKSGLFQEGGEDRSMGKKMGRLIIAACIALVLLAAGAALGPHGGGCQAAFVGLWHAECAG